MPGDAFGGGFFLKSHLKFINQPNHNNLFRESDKAFATGTEIYFSATAII